MMGFFLSNLPVQHLTVQFSSQIWVQGLSLQEIYATQFCGFALLLCGESFKAWSITYAVSEILEVYIWVQAATSGIGTADYSVEHSNWVLSTNSVLSPVILMLLFDLQLEWVLWIICRLSLFLTDPTRAECRWISIITAAGMQIQVYYQPQLRESRWRSISILTAAGILRDKVNQEALSSSSIYTPSWAVKLHCFLALLLQLNVCVCLHCCSCACSHMYPLSCVILFYFEIV